MSMAEPLLPHPRAADGSTPAAEPGSHGPEPESPEEPDVLPDADPTADGQELPERPVFRTPTVGERLHPEDLVDRA